MTATGLYNGLYAETWSMSQANCKRIEATHHRWLRRILIPKHLLAGQSEERKNLWTH